MTNRTETRRLLIDMRERLVGNLGQRIEGGDLALLAGIGAAIAAIDAEPGADPEAQPATRAVLTDDGSTATLTLYTGAGAVAAAPLSLRRLVGLAAELTSAAQRRL